MNRPRTTTAKIPKGEAKNKNILTKREIIVVRLFT